MKRALLLAPLSALVIISSCSGRAQQRVSSRSLPPATVGSTTIGYLDGVEKTASVEESAIGAALAGGLIKFGLESLKGWLGAKAASYEFKSKADRSIFVGGFGEASDGSFPYHSVMTKGGAILIARSAEVATDAKGIVPEAYRGLVLSAVDSNGVAVANQVGVEGSPGKLVDDALKALAAFNVRTEDGSHASNWVISELTRCGKLQDNQKSTAKVLSFAAFIVLEKATVGYSSVEAPATEESSKKALQFSLAGYTYPLPQVTKERLSGSKRSAATIKSMLTLGMEGPAGTASGPMGKYSASTVFAVKPDASREKTPLGTWLIHKKNPPTSSAFSVPHSNIVGLSGILVETSRLKKTLENLSKFVGHVSLTPADLGID